MNRLVRYVESRKLDGIAVTNHNLFDETQFMEISEAISIPVFPGIELDVDGCQILLISELTETERFAEKCAAASHRDASKSAPFTLNDIEELFGDLSEYLVIPHYEKKPAISRETLEVLAHRVTAGEVSSPKKFIYCLNDKNRLVPVLFSDCRIEASDDPFPVRQTFIDCDDVTFASLRVCLGDKHKVALTEADGNTLFLAFDNQMLSTGLNVIVGERSSGKSFTLERINDAWPNAKYIPQFSLVERNDDDDARRFDQRLASDKSLLSSEFLDEFRSVVHQILEVDVDSDDRNIDRYIDSLFAFARESEREDAFSNAILFSSEEYPIQDQTELKKLIASTEHLIANKEFRGTIDKYLPMEDLRRLIVDLMTQYGGRELDRQKKKWINNLVNQVKGFLREKTAITPIEDIDLYKIAINRHRVAKFQQVVELLRTEREIECEQVRKFSIVARATRFSGAMGLRTASKKNLPFKEAFALRHDPYRYLLALRSIDGLDDADLHRLFVSIEYTIKNQDGAEVSGGERSEFNLLQQIQDAQEYDILLIDEPESSFDNLFLRHEVNELVKGLAKQMPVVLVTHNSTVGFSIQPDFLLCTRKERSAADVAYRVYCGSPSGKTLKSHDGKSIQTLDVAMDCFEAGAETYDDRRRAYKNLED